MAHTYSHLFKIPTTGLRFFTVYGPWGRPDMAYFLFAEAIMKDKPIKMFNNGHMKRDFTYVEDIINGIVNVLDQPAQPSPEWNTKIPDPSISSAPYRVFNLGNNCPVDLIDFIHELERNCGKKANIDLMEMQPGDVEITWADVDDLQRNFNYKPTTTIERGLKEFTNWFMKFYSFDNSLVLATE